jgi:hypothetical protein
MDVNRWNGENFPMRIKIVHLEDDKVSLTVEKYLLDNLEGDVNLEDAPRQEVLSIMGNSELECKRVFRMLELGEI